LSDKKIILITGATDGVGKAAAKELSKLGHKSHYSWKKWRESKKSIGRN